MLAAGGYLHRPQPSRLFNKLDEFLAVPNRGPGKSNRASEFPYWQAA